VRLQSHQPVRHRLRHVLRRTRSRSTATIRRSRRRAAPSGRRRSTTPCSTSSPR
jgi:hypothetical protein